MIGVVILLLTMTAAVATSIVRCVMVLFAAGNSGLFSVITSVDVFFPDFCFVL